MLSIAAESRGELAETRSQRIAADSGFTQRNTQRKRLVQLTDASSMTELREGLAELLSSAGVLEAELRPADKTVWVHYDLQHINLAGIEEWLTAHGARLSQHRSAQRIRAAVHRVEEREQAAFLGNTDE